MRRGNLVSFYNEVCDYKVCYGRLIEEGKRSLLEMTLENVQEALEKLWSEYGRNFWADILKEDEASIDKRRMVFYRCILLPETKKNI